jgi:hypothetical protein
MFWKNGTMKDEPPNLWLSCIESSIGEMRSRWNGKPDWGTRCSDSDPTDSADSLGGFSVLASLG